MSKAGSTRTGDASWTSPSVPLTRMPRAPAPATTCAFVTTYPFAMTKPVPTDERPQVAAVTLNVLASATAAMARAVGSLGWSTGGAGSGSKPTKTSGRPVVSSQPPSPIGDLGGRREDAGHRADRGRAAGRLGQARDRTLGQQAAGQPDDEQDLDDAEACAGGPVSGPEKAGTQLGRDRAADGGADGLAEGDRADEPDEDDERPDGRVELREELGEVREREDRERRPRRSRRGGR